MIDTNGDVITNVSDMATAREALDRDAALASIRDRKPLAHTGRCHYCDEVVGDEQVFCDIECSRAWDLEQRARQRAGKGATA